MTFMACSIEYEGCGFVGTAEKWDFPSVNDEFICPNCGKAETIRILTKDNFRPQVGSEYLSKAEALFKEKEEIYAEVSRRNAAHKS